MKKGIIIATALLLPLVGGIGIVKLNKDFLLLWNANTIRVTTESPMTPSMVKIEHGIEIGNLDPTRDRDLLGQKEKYNLLFDGSTKEKMKNEYGENDFLITYGDRYYLQFRQFKFNRRHQHDYHFHLKPKDGKPFVEVRVKGTDATEFAGAMRLIR